MKHDTKVLLVVEPGLNGVFRHVEGLCNYLMGRPGVRVGLAYSGVRDSDALWHLVNSVRDGGGAVYDLNVGSNPSWRDLRAQAGLMRCVEKFAPHVVHAHSSKAGALGRGLWFLGSNVAHFYTPNAYFGLNKGSGVTPFVFNFIEQFLGQVGHTINVSGSERRFAKDKLRLSTRSLLAIPNAVDCTRFFPPTAEERQRARKALDLPEDAWVCGTVGRYSEQKDPRTLYAAVERLLTDSPEAWFAHLGEGEGFDEATRFLEGKAWARRVRRVRYDSSPAAFYRALDCFVLSSRFEGLPISGIEALATGLPLVFTRCPGCEDFGFMDLSGVYWGEVASPETLVGALRQAYQARAMRTNHRLVAESKFSPDAVYGRILEAYREAMAQAAGGRM